MSAGSVLRRLAGEVVDFVVFVGELLGGTSRDRTVDAVLQDLGAPPGSTSKLDLPAAQLASVKA